MSAEISRPTSAWTSTPSNLATVVDKYSARPRRTWSGSSPRPAESTRCCSSTRPTPSSASAATSGTPTTATRTSRAPTSCSGSRRSTASRPRDQPPGQHRRGVHPPTGRDHRLPRPDSPTCGLQLWRQCRVLPVAGQPLDIDVEFCAESFELAGGNIRLASIYRCLPCGSVRASRCGMADVIAAVGQEYRKLGRLTVAAEFRSGVTPDSAARPAPPVE